VKGPRHDWIALGLGVAAFVAAILLQIERDRWFPRAQQETDRILYVRSAAALKRLTLGFNALAADVYWIRALQHYGGDRLTHAPAAAKYQLLYPLLDITTTLDPYFSIAYRFGAIFLSEGYPGGPGRPDRSVELLRKALVAMPHKWQYFHDIGFVYYWHLRDYKGAAEWFQRAAAQPGAPNWLAPLAATMLVQGQDRASARLLWEQIAKSEEGWLRRGAERALLQLQLLDDMDKFDAAIRRVPRSPGERYSWSLLVRRGLVRGIPADPTGVPLVLDPDTGRVTVSPNSTLFPMPDEPRRPQ
jgi:tetratricopeptide (TPR) repeat protein